MPRPARSSCAKWKLGARARPLTRLSKFSTGPATHLAATTLRIPGSASLPMLVGIDEDPSESTSLRDGVIVDGRITKPGEIAKYKVAVNPGEEWVMELAAASLGTSQLDGLLTVFDDKGKK